MEKTTKGNGRHEYTFRRMFSCTACGRSLIAEKQKGHIYYRCHRCSGVSVNEDVMEISVKKALKYFNLSQQEIKDVENAQNKMLTESRGSLQIEREALTMEKEALENRLSKLVDALLDETISRDMYL